MYWLGFVLGFLAVVCARDIANVAWDKPHYLRVGHWELMMQVAEWRPAFMLEHNGEHVWSRDFGFEPHYGALAARLFPSVHAGVLPCPWTLEKRRRPRRRAELRRLDRETRLALGLDPDPEATFAARMRGDDGSADWCY